MVTSTDVTIRDLEDRARQLRITALEMIWNAASGHPGPSLSCADVVATLYFSVLRVRPGDPHWPDRDRFILSKGHAAPTLYAALAHAGYFPQETLKTFRQIDGILQGHPDMKLTPGVETTSGALGNGLSIGAGMALAARIMGRSYLVYVLLGDGECQEGQIWEAAMSAYTRRLGNLIAIVDRNGLQQSGSTENSAALEPFADKWRACGWRVREVDGHNISELLDAFDWAMPSQEVPSVVIAHTVKGKGVSFMEGRAEWHAKALSAGAMTQAMAELGKEWRA